MKVIVVRWTPHSECLKRNALIELAYPMMGEIEAKKMFKREYPKSDNLSFWEFDSEERKDLYRAFENAGSIRFFKVY